MMLALPLRSVLFVPAANPRALEKSAGLAADALIFDLEDSVLPEAKGEARERLRDHLAALPPDGAGRRALRIVRVNALSGAPSGAAAGTEDLLMARGAASPSRGGIDAILLPKVESAADIRLAADALAETDAAGGVEALGDDRDAEGHPRRRRRSRALLAASARSSPGRTTSWRRPAFGLSPGRPELLPWLAAIVLAAKAHGLPVIDGVCNDIGDGEGFSRECAAGRAMGFDGKTLIHPSQIEAAERGLRPLRRRDRGRPRDRRSLRFARERGQGRHPPRRADGRAAASLRGRAASRLGGGGRTSNHEDRLDEASTVSFPDPTIPASATRCRPRSTRAWELHGSPTYAFDGASGAMRCGQAVVKDLYGQAYDPAMTLGEQ